MQSIDDEIPDLSGPVSLGTYRFIRRSRGNKYETHKVGELQNAQGKESENKVTEPKSSSAHPPSNYPPTPTLLSSQPSNRPAHQTEAEDDNRIPNHLRNPSSDKRGSYEPSPPQSDKFDQSHIAASPPHSHRSFHKEKPSYPASARVDSSLLPAQAYPSSQVSRGSIVSVTPSLQTSGQVPPSFSPEYYSPNQAFDATINPDQKTPQPASKQVGSSARIQDHSSDQNFKASTDQARDPSQPPSRQAESSARIQDHSSIQNFKASINPDRDLSQSAFRQADSSLQIQDHNYQNFNDSINPDRNPSPSQPASRLATDSSLRTQDHSTGQNFNPSILLDRRGLHPASGQTVGSFLIQDHSSNHYFNAPLNSTRNSPQSALRQAGSSFLVHDHSSNQNFNASTNIDEQSLQAPGEPYTSFVPLDWRLDTSQQYGHLAKGLTALTKTDGQSSRVPEQARYLLPHQTFERLTSEPYRTIESKAYDLRNAHRQNSQISTPARRPAAAEAYASIRSFPLSDTLPTASFNLETNQWDPDLPDTSMSAHTPTNKSTRGGYSGQTSRMSSSRTPNPHAILTTTKSGRPYTNPWLPIDPQPTTAHQIAREPSSGHTNMSTQRDDAELVEHQPKTRYVDQEEARYRALEQAKFGQAEGSLDDPFQDQTTQIQQYGRNQPSTYAEYAAYEAAYGQLSDYGDHPTPTAYTSDPNTSQLFSNNNHQVTRAPVAGTSSYHGQRSAYEQQAANSYRAQNSGSAPHEQRSAHEITNSRAPVRLPAVKGTSEQPKLFPQNPSFESLSPEDSARKIAQNQRRRPTQSGVQAAPGRVSHAVPIRDPAAYTGSGLTTRRNQEALRQNLDSVVASSQVPTGSIRTVLNDPHRGQQPVSRPSSAATDTTVTGSTLRAQAPSYESMTAQRPLPINSALTRPGPGTDGRHGQVSLGGSELPLQSNAHDTFKNPERAAADPESMYRRESSQAPAIPLGFGVDVAAYTNKAGLPVAAIGAGNKFMNELVQKNSSKQRSQQRLEDATTWFRTDPRDLSHAAEVLPYKVLHMMSPQQFPLKQETPRSVGELADDSQDDDPSDRARQVVTPRPIGHGRPAGFITPPSSHGPSGNMEGDPSGQKFLQEDRQAIEAMFGGVYNNLMAGMNGPYDYMNHYCPPPPHAIDHNAKNNHTLFDPQWFATAPPARVGRDPRREQGEYEDPTQKIAMPRDSGGRGAGRGGVRGWGRS